MKNNFQYKLIPDFYDFFLSVQLLQKHQVQEHSVNNISLLNFSKAFNLIFTQHSFLYISMFTQKFNCLIKKVKITVINCSGNQYQFSHSVMPDSLWPHELQHTRPACPSQTFWVYSNSCLLSQWWHPTISSPVIPFSFHL